MAPPLERFESRRSLKRSALRAAAPSSEARLSPGSRADKRRARCEVAWDADAEIDSGHAALGRGAARFLTVREFEDSAALLSAVDAELRALEGGCEVWATDLGQGAEVLAADAPWAASCALPKRCVLVLGTESTGVSTELLTAADRRVYLPMHGFADSLNVGVAAALAIEKVQQLLGAQADYLDDDHDDDAAATFASPRALREAWAAHLSRDPDHLTAIMSAIDDHDAPILDDLRRPDEFRDHCGRVPSPASRRERRAAAAAKDASAKQG